MELVYSALLLHSLGKEISEDNVEKVLVAAGGKHEKTQVKALVSSLKDINIDEAIKQTAVIPAAAPAAAQEEKPKEKPKKEEKTEEKKSEEAAAGLSSLFG